MRAHALMQKETRIDRESKQIVCYCARKNSSNWLLTCEL